MIRSALVALTLMPISAGVLAETASSTDQKALSITRSADEEPAIAPADNFTGIATVSSRFSSGRENGYGGAMVEFEAGARTAWHTHPLGQTLIIISGSGRVQSDGEPVQKVSAGDVVWIPAGERHWHGAAPDDAMSHIAIAEPLDGVRVVWMEKVSDDNYLRR